MSYYAPPDTGVPNLRLVTVEHLPSIEGADRICRSAPFCGEIIFICSALGRGGALLLQNSPQRLPLQGPIPPIRGKCPEGTKGVGMLSAKQTERLSQIRLDLSVSASPSHLPWKGRLWAVLICKIIRYYGNIAIGAKHSTLRYNDTSISKEALALPRWFWYPESS